MKTITFIRHAKSSYKDQSLDDFDRPLNKRGLKNAPLMSKILKEKKLFFDLMVSSPALRTKLTTKLIAKEQKCKNIVYEDSLYCSSPTIILEVISKINDKYKNIAIIGHNDELTACVNMLCDINLDNLVTCAFVSINFDTNKFAKIKKGKHIFYEYPRKYS